jgi:hypothetical protein
MWLKILGLMMQQQGFRSPQSLLPADTKAAVNSPTFPTTVTLCLSLLTKGQRFEF